MRLVIILLLAAVAIWRAAVDWQATIGAGNAYRLSSLGDSLSGIFPDSSFLHGIAGTTPGGAVLSLPLALVLSIIAWALWLSRPRQRGR